MQIELTRRGFVVHLSNGKHRRYRYLVLLPLVLTPVLFVATLCSREPIRTNLALALRNPDYLIVAGHALLLSSSKAIENLVAVEPVRRDSQLPTLNLFASKRTLTEMQRAIRAGDPRLGHDPGGDRPYCSAVYLDEHQQIQPCNISLRGFNQWHHWESKPSLRIKIRKSDVRQGRRYVELSRPKDVLSLKNWIPQEFARTLGLLSDKSDHVRLFINRKYAGVYLRSMRPGEPLAIAHGRLPGTFFKGDEEQDVLWTSIAPWSQHGEENEANVANFRRFLGHLRRTPTADNIADLVRFLDADAYAKWAALMIVTGSVHTDSERNHLYFVSSNRGVIEPVPWDCESYGMQADPLVPPDVILHPPMHRVICDPRWVHRRNQYIFHLLETVATPERMDQLIDDTTERMLADLRSDDHLASLEQTPNGWRLVPHSVLGIDDQRQEIKDWAKRRYDFLMEFLSDARVHVEPHPEREGASLVRVFGTAAVHVGTVERCVDAEPQLLLPGLSADVYQYVNRPFSRQVVVEYATPAVLVYDVDSPPSQLHFTNAITGKPVRPQRPRPAGLPPTRSIHPSAFEPEPVGDVVLGPGQVELTENLMIGPKQRLIVRPGTSIRVAAGVGIYSRGITMIDGTAEEPVEIVAAGEEPWAAFAVYGRATAGSQVAHLRISGGSLGSDGVAHFKGMFNVYNCPQVTLRHCEFGRNLDSDDAVNIAESKALIEDCLWRAAAADGLDLDMCEGLVRRCVWEQCGNDGLDLMGCNVRVQHCRFTGNGDKGISAGEGSRLVVSDSTLAACDIGVEVKDASSVLIRDCVFEANRLALHSYQKHWMYGNGGRTALSSCLIVGSREADLAIEKRSQVLLCRTPISSIAEGVQRVSEVDELGAEWDVD